MINSKYQEAKISFKMYNENELEKLCKQMEKQQGNDIVHLIRWYVYRSLHNILCRLRINSIIIAAYHRLRLTSSFFSPFCLFGACILRSDALVCLPSRQLPLIVGEFH